MTARHYLDAYDYESQFGTGVWTLALVCSHWGISERDVLSCGTNENDSLQFVINLPETQALRIPMENGKLDESRAIEEVAKGLYWVPPSEILKLLAGDKASIDTGLRGEYAHNYEIFCHEIKQAKERPLIFRPPIEVKISDLFVTNGAFCEYEKKHPNLDSSKKVASKFPSEKSVLKKRISRLRQWLTEKEIPDDQWENLGELGYKMKSLYEELIQYPEFKNENGHGKPITLNYFKRYFWKDQKIAAISKNNAAV